MCFYNNKMCCHFNKWLPNVVGLVTIKKIIALEFPLQLKIWYIQHDQDYNLGSSQLRVYILHALVHLDTSMMLKYLMDSPIFLQIYRQEPVCTNLNIKSNRQTFSRTDKNSNAGWQQRRTTTSIPRVEDSST